MAGETLPPVVAQLVGDTANLLAKLDEAKGKLTDFASGNYNADLGVNAAAAETEVDHVTGLLDQYGNKSPTARLGISDDAAKAHLDKINESLDAYGSRSPKATVQLGGFEETIAKIDLLNAKLDELGAKDEHPRESVDSSEAEKGLGLILTAILALGPAAVGVAAVIGSAFAAIPGIIGGALAGFGAVGFGISGLTKAFQAQSQASGSAGAAANTAASQALSSAQSIKSAANSVISAQEAVKNSEVTGAQQIISAERSVASAVQSYNNARIASGQATASAYRSIVSAQAALANAEIASAQAVYTAQEQLTSAEQSYTAAVRGEQQAQDALIAARQAAQDQLQSYTDQMADSALTAQQDQLNLVNAQSALQQGQAAGTTGSAMDQLILNVALAKQAIQDQGDQYAILKRNAAAADAAGVEGAAGVISATQGVAAAQQNVTNAQQAQTDAATNLYQTQVSGLSSVANAQQALADSENSYANTQRTNAQSVSNALKSVAVAETSLGQTRTKTAQSTADAERSLNMALDAQQTTLAQIKLQSAAAAGGSSALQAAMAKLTPAARQFVEYVKSDFLPQFHELKAQDQAILLPGLESAMKTLGPAIGAVKPFILDAAKGIAQMANDLAKFASSTKGLADIKAVFGSGNKLFTDLGKAVVTFVEAFANLGAIAGPIVNSIGHGAQTAADAFNNWTTDGGAAKFLKYVEGVGPSVAKFLKDIVGAFVSWGKALAPFAGAQLQVLAMLAQFISLISRINPDLVALISVGIGLVSIIGKMKVAFEALKADPILLVLTAVALAADFVITHWNTFKEGFITIWDDVKKIFDEAWGFIKDHISIVVPAILTLILGPFGLLAGEIATHWTTIKNDAVTAWNDIVDFFTGIKDKILGAFNAALSWLTSIGKDIIHGLWTGIQAYWNDYIVGFLGGMAKAVLGFVVAADTWLYQVGKDIIQGLWNGITEIWALVVAWFKDVKQWGIDALLSIGQGIDWLEQIGEHVVQGLWNGMTKIWDKVVGWLKGIANSIGGIFNKILGNNSPSKVFHEVGTNVMLGLSQGLTDTFASHVAPTMKSISQGIIDGLSGSSISLSAAGGVSPLIASAGNAQPVILQVTTPVQVNGQTLASTVTNYQLRDARSQGNVLGRYAGGSQVQTATGLSPNAIQR